MADWPSLIISLNRFSALEEFAVCLVHGAISPLLTHVFVVFRHGIPLRKDATIETKDFANSHPTETYENMRLKRRHKVKKITKGKA
jgi:hypothetical protein